MDSSWASQLGRLLLSSFSFLATLRKPSSKSGDKLCSACSKIKFSKLFKSSTGHPSPKWNQSFSACAAAANVNCPFCRLLWEQSSANNFTKGNPQPGSKINVEVNFDKFSIVGQSEDTYVPYIRVDGDYGFTNSIHLIHSQESNSERNSMRYLFRRRPLSSFVDIKLIQQWLGVCELNHDRCRKSVHDGGHGFAYPLRVIDISKRCIVEAPADCKYVALSYVWGGPDIPQLELQQSTASRLHATGGLSESHSDIPATIADAMILCSMVGRYYLWVDALCIEQDNPEDQSRQIYQMNSMYALADFTIVSAFGLELLNSCNSWSGLPGVGRPRISRQRIEEIREQQFGNPAMGRFLEEVHLFFWSRRAWTMQEMYLSRRVIYFAEFQTYYQCGETLWREDQYLECNETIRIESNEYYRLAMAAIQTEERGLSERIRLVDDKVAVHEWVAYKPQWRTVFLL